MLESGLSAEQTEKNIFVLLTKYIGVDLAHKVFLAEKNEDGEGVSSDKDLFLY